jgi:uncharacterized damage-inducible protein DinB
MLMDNMDPSSWQRLVRESFEYDKYANFIWLPFIVGVALPEEKQIFNHILAASTVWVARMDGVSLNAMPEVAIHEDSIIDLHQRWMQAIVRYKFDDLISYRNTRGDPFESTFGDITRHVTTHGTYHRGQIREKFGARGANFPETDFIQFARDRGRVR